MASFTNFKALKRPSSPNYFLACPAQYCNIKPDQVVPIYPISVEQLQHKWYAAVRGMPRWELVQQRKNQLEYIQRSWLFRFPDLISVQFISEGEGRSSIALLSRAKYGYYDFGVNKRRVLSLLERLHVDK